MRRNYQRYFYTKFNTTFAYCKSLTIIIKIRTRAASAAATSDHTGVHARLRRKGLVQDWRAVAADNVWAIRGGTSGLDGESIRVKYDTCERRRRRLDSWLAERPADPLEEDKQEEKQTNEHRDSQTYHEHRMS